MSDLSSLTVIVRGKHDTGKTTAANLIKIFLEENGYDQVTVRDVPPLPSEKKDEFMRRFTRNRGRPVSIRVELDEGSSSTMMSNEGLRTAACERAEAFFDAIDKKDFERIKSCLTADKFLHFLALAELFAAKDGA